MPAPAIIHAIRAPATPVSRANRPDRENTPAPTIDPTTIEVMARTDSFTGCEVFVSVICDSLLAGCRRHLQPLRCPPERALDHIKHYALLQHSLWRNWGNARSAAFWPAGRAKKAGPELERTGPARIKSGARTRQIHANAGPAATDQLAKTRRGFYLKASLTFSPACLKSALA